LWRAVATSTVRDMGRATGGGTRRDERRGSGARQLGGGLGERERERMAGRGDALRRERGRAKEEGGERSVGKSGERLEFERGDRKYIYEWL